MEYRSYAAAKRRLTLVYCYVQGGYDAVVVSSEDTYVFVLLLAFSSSIDASLICSRNEVLRHAQG